MEPWGPQSGLLDLPAAVWAQILASVASKDIVALSTTCRELTHLTADVRWRQFACPCLPARPPPPPPALAALCESSPFSTAPLALATIAHRQDALWQRQCEAWLAAARSPSNGLAALTAPALRGALRLPSYHCLYKALHQLGSWPAGIWYATNDSALPCGRLLVAQLHPPSGTLRLQPPRHHVLNGPAPAADAWELRPGWCIRAEAGEGGIWVRSMDGSQGNAMASATQAARAPLAACSLPHPAAPSFLLQVGVEAIDNATGALHCAMQLSLDGRSLIMHRSQQRRRPPPAAGHRTLLPAAPEGSGGASGSGGATGSGSGSGGSNSVPSSSAGQALASLAAYLGLHNARLLLESISYCRVQLPAPADLEAVAGEPPGMALLRRHQARARRWAARGLP